MNLHQRTPDKGDPSSVLQFFPNFNIELLCCRCWRVSRWEFNELSYPYWRLYYNNKKGATVNYKGINYQLDPDHIFIIAPNTPYSTKLFDYPIPKEGYFFKGFHFSDKGISMEQQTVESILHLFIHFKLGFPYDDINPGIYSIKAKESQLLKLRDITEYLRVVKTNFDFNIVIAIQSLITDLLCTIPSSDWNFLAKDFRISSTLKFIDQNITTNLSNSTLAKKVNVSTNSFNRLFRETVGTAPQKYVKKKRIDKACIMLYHNNLSLEEIAMHCGFANRYHFSRIFKQITGFSPAQYRKERRIISD